MKRVEISWSGDVSKKRDIHPHAAWLVHQLCDEYGEAVQASVHIQPNLQRGKFPVFRQGRLFLVVFRADFGVIIDIDYVNIREMIFMYDNVKVPHSDLPTEYAEIINHL